MPHEIDRVLRLASQGVWLIEPAKAQQILAVLSLRAQGHTQASYTPPPQQAATQAIDGGSGTVHVLRVSGSIMPRANLMSEMSGGVTMETFQRDFRQAAADPGASAILLDIDSPGGMVDLVPETAEMIFAARREGRPIVAVANTMAASAAYYLAAAADEIVVSPSGIVGSIGVYLMHDDMSARLEQEGIARTFIFEGARKVEGHPFAPLDETARASLQAAVRYSYDAFTGDVARFRGVPASVVRADPEADARHFGGGRTYHATEAVRLGMADRVATLQDTLERLANPRRPRRVSTTKARLRLV